MKEKIFSHVSMDTTELKIFTVNPRITDIRISIKKGLAITVKQKR